MFQNITVMKPKIILQKGIDFFFQEHFNNIVICKSRFGFCELQTEKKSIHLSAFRTCFRP